MTDWKLIGDESTLPKDRPFMIYRPATERGDDWSVGVGEWWEADRMFFSHGCGWDYFTHWADITHPE